MTHPPVQLMVTTLSLAKTIIRPGAFFSHFQYIGCRSFGIGSTAFRRQAYFGHFAGGRGQGNRQAQKSIRLATSELPTYKGETRRAIKCAMSYHTACSAQAVGAPLTKSATFLVVTVNEATPNAAQTVRSAIASIDDLAKNVAIRDPGSPFNCTVGIGSRVWDSLTGGLSRPAELRALEPVRGATHTAVSTPGDVLFHIRSDRRDICFEFERQLMGLLGDAVTVVDATQGFRYFDARDLLGFVDGTANPTGPAVPASVLVGSEDDGDSSSSSRGGSYILVQKYVHDMKSWWALSTEQQEATIGRTKLDNVELDDAGAQEQKSHKTLSTIEDEQGREYSILRDNMPFGSPSEGVYGTYFIGYSNRLWVMERMLERIFIGDPPGKHDRILDYSRALTGTVFFAPSASILAGFGE